MLKKENSVMLTQAENARFKPNIVLQILIFIAVFIASSVAMGIIAIIPLAVSLFSNPDFLPAVTSGNEEQIISVAESVTNSDVFMIVALFLCVLEILIPILYCVLIEKRNIRSIGFCKEGFAKKYLFGFLIGAVMLALSEGIAMAFGAVSVTVSAKIPVVIILVYLLGYMIQGAGEEVMLRGYFLPSLSNSIAVPIAVGISSVAFSLMHLGNPGVTVLAIINIALFGLFMALYVLRTDNLWGACAIHSAWNFFQGNIFGVQVSGTGYSSSVLTSSFNDKTLINGGSFGLEGGLAVTIVLAVAIALVIFIPKRKNAQIEE